MCANEIVLFESSDGKTTIPVEVDYSNNEVWLSRRQLAELFGRDVKTIGKHINNAASEELSGQANRVVAKFATTASDGKKLPDRALWPRHDSISRLSREIATRR